MKKQAKQKRLKERSNKFRFFILILLAIIILSGALSYISYDYGRKIEAQAVTYNYPSDLIKDFYKQINDFRKNRGLNELKPAYDLERTAANKAQIMIDMDCWAHTCGSIDPSHPIDRILTTTSYIMAGENLAQGYYNTKEALKAWIVSPEHLANLIKPDYKFQGVAIVCNIRFHDNNNNCLFVHHFAS